MKLVTGSGLEWVFMQSGSETIPNGILKGENRIVNITYRGKLPTKAHDAHLVNGNDINRLAYTLEVSPAKPKTLLYGSVVLILGAIGLGLISTRTGSPTRVYPSLLLNREEPGKLPPS
jgi:hypothetical protein